MNKSKHTKQMLIPSWLRVFSIMLLVLITSIGAYAQCDNTLIGGAFGSVTAPASGTATISTCSYLQEYSTLNAVAAATTYQCAITTGGFVTIRQGSSTGPVVAFGTSPLTWSSSVAGTYFAHWNVNAACGLSTGCVVTTMTYVGPATGCSGTPTGGIATANNVATTNGACVGQTLSLAVTGSTVAGGLTYQWNYSANSGGPYTPIAGATSAGYSITSYSAANAGFYVRDITCASSTSTSVEVGVTTNAPVACYCTTGLSINGGGGDNITNVTIGAVNNTTSGNVAPYYTLYSTPVITLMQSTFEPISITFGPDGSQHSAVWIDFNQDGNFDVSENVAISTVAAGGNATVTYSLAIPSSGPTGLTRMRVRGGSDGPYASNGACLAYSWGETEDYVVDIVANTLCSGTPTPGNTLATATSACPGQSVMLSLQNLTPGSGVTYQWVNNAGNIPGATNPTYSAVVGDDYYCNVTCAGNTGASVLITIGVNPFQNCYCSTNLHSFASPCITQIDFNTLSNASPAACALPAYTAYPAATATTTVYTGFTYNLTRQSSGTNVWTGIWIDYDHSGSFDASEYTQMSTTATGTLSDVVAITIPTTALTGQTGMRIRQRAADMTAADACTQGFGSGESEDYVIDIQIPLPCTGTPTPGNTIASAASACPGQTVNLSLQNFTSGSGVTYQWVNNAGNIPGATNATYAALAGDDYYCNVTCSGNTGASVLITIGISPFSSCYCSTGLGGICGTQSINSVAIASTTLNNVTNGCTTPYSVFPASGTTTATLYTSFYYDFTVGTGNNGNAAQVAMWIDYDHSGTYDAAEFTLISASSPSAGSSTLNYQIPVTALTGATGMRIRTDWELSTAFLPTDACVNKPYGETEDYTVDIQVPSACTGTPAPGNTIASAASVCSGATVNFSLQFNTPGSGVSYQWVDGNGPIAGATNPTYSKVITVGDDFYCDVTCGSNTTSSTLVTVNLNAPSSCYCIPIYTVGNTDGDLISDITIAGTTLANNTGSSTVLNPYTYYTTIPSGLPLNQTAVLQAGSSYSVTVTFGSYIGGGQNAAAWIDYNDDGVFSTPSERIGFTTSASVGAFGVANFPIILNCAPPLGVHRMRVRDVFAVSGINIDPCASYSFGETEDYDITITAAVPCPQPTSLAATGITFSDATLSWTAGCLETSWDVHVALAGSGTPGTPSNPAVTNPVTVSGLLPLTNYEYYVRAVCGGLAGSSAWSGPFNFTTPIGPCTGTPVIGTASASLTSVCAGSQPTILTLSGVPTNPGIALQWFNGAGAISGATNATYTTTVPGASETFYCEVTCVPSASMVASNSVTVTTIPSPVGSSFANPILVGQAPCATAAYTNTQTNTIANCFGNNNTSPTNQSSPDVYYQFTLAAPAIVELSHCASTFDTYIHLLDATGTELAFNDDNGLLCTGATASLSQSLAAGTYYVVSEGFGGNTGAITTSIKTTDPCVTNTTLNLTCFIQGYWDGTSGMVPVLLNQGQPTTTGACDSIDVILKDATTYATVASTRAVLNQNGTCTAVFAGSYPGSYYIAVEHRSAIATWSAAPVSMAGSPSYDFTTASTQSYGPNMVEVAAGVWAFYSGDVVKDISESIEIADITLVELDNSAFAFGYVITDINGDGGTDLSDFPLMEANINLFIFSNHP